MSNHHTPPPDTAQNYTYARSDSSGLPFRIRRNPTDPNRWILLTGAPAVANPDDLATEGPSNPGSEKLETNDTLADRVSERSLSLDEWPQSVEGLVDAIEETGIREIADAARMLADDPTQEWFAGASGSHSLTQPNDESARDRSVNDEPAFDNTVGVADTVELLESMLRIARAERERQLRLTKHRNRTDEVNQ